MKSSCKYRRSFTSSPASHLLLCGRVPNRSRTSTDLWPGGWEPLSQSTLHWTSSQILPKDQFDPSYPPSDSSTRSSWEHNSSPHFLPYLPKWWSLLPLATLSPLIQYASDSVMHHWFIKFLGAGVGWGMRVCVSVSDMYEFQKCYT